MSAHTSARAALRMVGVGERRGFDGVDVERSTGRLLSVAELQQTLRQYGVDSVSLGALPAATAAAPTAGSRQPDTTALSPVDTLDVVSAHPGAGCSTVALALADAAGSRVHLIEWCDARRPGTAAAADREMGVIGPAGLWRRGTRGQVVIDRLEGDRLSIVPRVPRVELAINDWGCSPDSGPARANPRVVVCRVTVPSVLRVEQVLASAGDGAVLAALGPRSWPRTVLAAQGPVLTRWCRSGRVVTMPLDRQLEVSGPTSGPLPRPILAAARRVLTLVAETCRSAGESDRAGWTA